MFSKDLVDNWMYINVTQQGTNTTGIKDFPNMQNSMKSHCKQRY